MKKIALIAAVFTLIGGGAFAADCTKSNVGDVRCMAGQKMRCDCTVSSCKWNQAPGRCHSDDVHLFDRISLLNSDVSLKDILIRSGSRQAISQPGTF